MKFRLILIFCLLLSIFTSVSYAQITGIYINSTTAVSDEKMDYLIKNAKEVGIKTFVVDFEINSPKYASNVAKLKQNGIRYVARVVIFPGGATPDQVDSTAYLQKRINQIDQAIQLGADEIQIDYIRFKPTQRPSEENAVRIAKVIQYFSKHVAEKGLPMQIDVFGISSFKPSIYIGQDNKLIAPQVSAICPMVYPSHYVPYNEHARQPYKTIYTSLVSLKKQIKDYPQVKVIAYIEIFNFRYPMSDERRTQYILSEMRAVRDAKANGWYVWSAGNKYGFLFQLLKDMQAGKLSLQMANTDGIDPNKQANQQADRATPDKSLADVNRDVNKNQDVSDQNQPVNKQPTDNTQSEVNADKEQNPSNSLQSTDSGSDQNGSSSNLNQNQTVELGQTAGSAQSAAQSADNGANATATTNINDNNNSSNSSTDTTDQVQPSTQ